MGDVIADRLLAGIGPLADLVSPRTGIIRSLQRVSRGTEEPSVPVVVQSSLSQFDYRRGNDSDRTAAGKGETEREAALGAIGEALERYCSYQHNPQAVFHETTTALGAAAIRPAEFVLYSDRQYASPGFRYPKPDDAAPIAWTTAVELPAKSVAYAPSSLVYLYFDPNSRDGYFCPATSNGLAAGPTLQSAILSGLYELIERDAFLINWMNRLPAPRVDYSTATGIATRIRSHYARFGVEAAVFDITNDIGVPVMMAMALDHSGNGPSVVIGLGCHLDPAVALKKALMEVCQVRPSETLKFATKPPADRLHKYSDVKTLEDHAGFAAIAANLHEFDFLLKNDGHVKLDNLPNGSCGDIETDLHRCVALLRAQGSRVAYVDLTTPDVEPYGMYVARAIATGLQPMHFGHGEERLGGTRLFAVPTRMGFANDVRTAADLNPCPHPLA